jgi:ATP-dependent RNA helicase DDX41
LSKDVLVATDIISKGLDFDVNHVINFDMPTEIENYVHRIGRTGISSGAIWVVFNHVFTGRCGKTGLATTLICQEQSEVVLGDLKHLLVEAKQKVPAFLSSCEKSENQIEEDKELIALTGVRGCSYCGGLGHRIGSKLSTFLILDHLF